MTKKFHVEFCMDSAAFFGDTGMEEAKILRRIAKARENGQTVGDCRDHNNNLIGKWWIRDEAEEIEAGDKEDARREAEEKKDTLIYRAEIFDFGSDYCGNPTAHWSMKNDAGERVGGSKSRRVQCGYQNERDDGPLVTLYGMHPGARIKSRVTEGSRQDSRMWVELTVWPKA